MVNRGSIHAESVSYIAMPFKHPFLNTTFRKVSVLMSELVSAFEKVMEDVILNPSFNQDLFNQICSKIKGGDKTSSGGENKGKEKFKSFEKGQDKKKEK